VATKPFGSANSGIATNAFQTIASIVVAIGMAHVGKVLTEHVLGRKAEEEAGKVQDEKQADTASLLQKKIAELIDANDHLSKARLELEQTAGVLQAELATLQTEAANDKADAAQLKRTAEDLARTNNRMAFSHEEELRRSSAAIQAKVNELERSRVEQERMCSEQVKLRAEQEKLRAQMDKTCKQLADALAASSAAEANAATLKNDAEILKNNTATLKNVRKLLSEATTSAGTVVNHVAKFRNTNTSHITRLLRPAAKKPGNRAPANGNTKRLPISIAVLSRQLTREQSTLVHEIDSLKKKIERIQKVAAAESFEETASASDNQILQHADTETATSIEPDSSNDTTRCTRDDVNGASNDLPVLN
jgi:hypothetical protein